MLCLSGFELYSRLVPLIGCLVAIPRVNLNTLSKHESHIRRRSGSIEFTYPGLVFLEFNSMLFLVSQF